MILVDIFRRYLFTFLLKHLIYPFLYRRMRLLRPITRFHFLIIACYAVGTILCNFWGVTTAAEASSRAGLLSTANFIPLLFSGRMSTVADLLGLNVQTVALTHIVVGLLASGQATVHAILAARISEFSWSNLLDLYGFLVSYKLDSEVSWLILK